MCEGGHRRSGGPRGFLANARSGDMDPLHRAGAIAANLLRRAVRSPHDCCGHYGEPGC
jgi:hypothetical protein